MSTFTIKLMQRDFSKIVNVFDVQLNVHLMEFHCFRCIHLYQFCQMSTQYSFRMTILLIISPSYLDTNRRCSPSSRCRPTVDACSRRRSPKPIDRRTRRKRMPSPGRLDRTSRCRLTTRTMLRLCVIEGNTCQRSSLITNQRIIVIDPNPISRTILYT